jgi:peptidoglycan/LPS O-acetylase OafA/YrhL
LRTASGLAAADAERGGARAADGDRRFRPDVEGLRAVAVGTVVLYHGGIPGLGGGFVGVDVFFVISGFVITRLLLGQVERSGRPRFAEFYARRARRILPAAAFVALVAAFFSYRYLGFVRGNLISDDMRWVAVFLGNVHFAAAGTNYFQAEIPPSTLQNYWSLAVEEQFYLIYPALLFALAYVRGRTPVRVRLFVAGAAIFAVSYAWSIVYTRHNPAAAYFSLSTRAWELALGGMVAAGTQMWRRIPPAAAAAIAWVGMALIVAATVGLSASTPYPGSIALLPVAGSALVILGGVAAPRRGPEMILGTAPFRWIGKLSFSIYLWHWPIVMTVEENRLHEISVAHRLILIALSVVASVVTFYGLEDPIRRSGFLSRRPVRSLLVGAAIIVTMLVVGTWEIHLHHG